MVSKSKAISIIIIIIGATIAIFLGIRLVSWMLRALLFGLGGFLFGAVFGAIWMNRRMKRKATESKEK